MDTQLRPARAIKPGDILKEELEERGWTQEVFADIIGRPKQAVNEIIAGKKAITPETALLMAAALGTTAQFWLNIESSYRLLLVSGSAQEQEVSKRSQLHEVVPVKELVKRGWIRPAGDVEDLEMVVAAFLGAPSVDTAWSSLAARFRLSQTRTPETASLVAWLRRAETMAAQTRVGSFDATTVACAAADLRHLSVHSDGPQVLLSRLRELGVRATVVPHLPRTYVDGATFWLADGDPAMALSVRHKRLDYFWFTVMHELAHVIDSSDGASAVFVDDLTEQSKSAAEKRADKKANDWLIPPDDYRRFVNRCRGRFSRIDIVGFAKEQGVSPAIVLGRLQHEGKVPYANLRTLLGKVAEDALT